MTFLSLSKRQKNAVNKDISRIEEEHGVLILGETFVFEMEQAVSGDQNLVRTTASAQKPVAEGGDGTTVMETAEESVETTEGSRYCSFDDHDPFKDVLYAGRAGIGTAEATQAGGETAELPEVTVEQEVHENKAGDDGPAVEATEAGFVITTATGGETAELPEVTVEEVHENKAGDGKSPAVQEPEKVKAVGKNGDVEKSAGADVATKENGKKVCSESFFSSLFLSVAVGPRSVHRIEVVR